MGRLRGAYRLCGMSMALIALSAGLASCQIGTAGPPPIIGKNCGSVHQGFRVVGDPSGPENCLWQAWTRCQTATLVYLYSGVDTGDTHTITVQPAGSACGVSDAEQSYSANFGGSESSTTTYTCASLERAPDGGLIAHACGAEGDLTIPPIGTPTPTPHMYPPIYPGITPT